MIYHDPEVPARPTITENQAEAMCDRMVIRRLASDRAYLDAEDAEQQALAEDAIAEACWAEIERKYEIV